MRVPITQYDAPDQRLWVRLDARWQQDPSMRWLIAGSAQTHRGHFHVCSVAGDEHRSVRCDEIVEASPEAVMWLDGFLHGQVATRGDFLGQDEQLMARSDDADEERLRAWNQRFLQNGFAPSLAPLPSRSPRWSEVSDPPPWCYIGDQYRLWADGDWVVADPQPADPPDIGFWPGSACHALGEHDLEELDADSQKLLCGRCHLAT